MVSERYEISVPNRQYWRDKEGGRERGREDFVTELENVAYLLKTCIIFPDYRGYISIQLEGRLFKISYLILFTLRVNNVNKQLSVICSCIVYATGNRMT